MKMMTAWVDRVYHNKMNFGGDGENKKSYFVFYPRVHVYVS